MVSMEHLSREKVKQLALNCMFKLSDEEADLISQEFDVLMSQMALLDKIDTTDVETMDYPFESPFTYLREDDEVINLSVDEALSNGPLVEDNFFVVPKVVK